VETLTNIDHPDVERSNRLLIVDDNRAIHDDFRKIPELLTYESSKVSAFYLKTPREWSSAGAVWNLEKRFLFG
jgi:hypothetical protein